MRSWYFLRFTMPCQKTIFKIFAVCLSLLSSIIIFSYYIIYAQHVSSRCHSKSEVHYQIYYISKFPPVFGFFLWVVCQDYTFVTVKDFKLLLYHGNLICRICLLCQHHSQSSIIFNFRYRQTDSPEKQRGTPPSATKASEPEPPGGPETLAPGNTVFSLFFMLLFHYCYWV